MQFMPNRKIYNYLPTAPLHTEQKEWTRGILQLGEINMLWFPNPYLWSVIYSGGRTVLNIKESLYIYIY